MPVPAAGAFKQVTTAGCFPSNLSSSLHRFDSAAPFTPKITTSPSPPPAYTTIYPISPPSSPLDLSELAIKDLSLGQFVPKPLLTPRSSASDTNSTTVLTSIFPTASPIHALPTQVVDLDDLVPNWKGAVLDNPAMGTRTLYVSGGAFEDVNLRESVCGILEKAEEELGCTGVVMCLEKNTPDLGESHTHIAACIAPTDARRRRGSSSLAHVRWRNHFHRSLHRAFCLHPRRTRPLNPA
jgi:hypothetical protein